MSDNNGTIIISRSDRKRLVRTIWPNGKVHDRDLPWNVTRLLDELNRARLVDSKKVPPDIVTMNSTVEVRSGNDSTDSWTLTYPADADIDAGRISVLSPMGLALLGARLGEEVRWETPAGPRRYTVERIIFQPESARRWDL